MDLHDLTREFGTKGVAARIRTTERRVVDIRRGRVALTVDDLYLLLAAFPRFNIIATIKRIGERRDRKLLSRWHRPPPAKRPPTPQAPKHRTPPGPTRERKDR